MALPGDTNSSLQKGATSSCPPTFSVNPQSGNEVQEDAVSLDSGNGRWLLHAVSKSIDAICGVPRHKPLAI